MSPPQFPFPLLGHGHPIKHSKRIWNRRCGCEWHAQETGESQFEPPFSADCRDLEDRVSVCLLHGSWDMFHVLPCYADNDDSDYDYEL